MPGHGVGCVPGEEVSKVAINWQMDKQNVPWNSITHEKICLFDIHSNIHEPQKPDAMWENQAGKTIHLFSQCCCGREIHFLEENGIEYLRKEVVKFESGNVRTEKSKNKVFWGALRFAEAPGCVSESLGCAGLHCGLDHCIPSVQFWQHLPPLICILFLVVPLIFFLSSSSSFHHINMDGWEQEKLMPVWSLLKWERECEGPKGQAQRERGVEMDWRAAQRIMGSVQGEGREWGENRCWLAQLVNQFTEGGRGSKTEN